MIKNEKFLNLFTIWNDYFICYELFYFFMVDIHLHILLLLYIGMCRFNGESYEDAMKLLEKPSTLRYYNLQDENK